MRMVVTSQLGVGFVFSIRFPKLGDWYPLPAAGIEF